MEHQLHGRSGVCPADNTEARLLRVQRTGRAHHLWLLLLVVLLQDLIGSNQVVHVMQTYTEEFAD